MKLKNFVPVNLRLNSPAQQHEGKFGVHIWAIDNTKPDVIISYCAYQCDKRVNALRRKESEKKIL